MARVWRQLKASGIRVGKRRVERTMRQNGLRGRGKRRFRVVTTDSNHLLPIAPNLLARNFTVAAANTVWAGASWAGRWARRSRRSWPAARSTWPGTAGRRATA